MCRHQALNEIIPIHERCLISLIRGCVGRMLMRAFESACHLHGSTMLASMQAVGKKPTIVWYWYMRKIVIYVVVAVSRVSPWRGWDKSREVQAENTRKSASRMSQTFSSDAARKACVRIWHSFWHSRRKRHRSRKLLLAVGRDAGEARWGLGRMEAMRVQLCKKKRREEQLEDEEREDKPL